MPPRDIESNSLREEQVDELPLKRENKLVVRKIAFEARRGGRTRPKKDLDKKF